MRCPAASLPLLARRLNRTRGRAVPAPAPPLHSLVPAAAHEHAHAHTCTRMLCKHGGLLLGPTGGGWSCRRGEEDGAYLESGRPADGGARLPSKAESAQEKPPRSSALIPQAAEGARGMLSQGQGQGQGPGGHHSPRHWPRDPLPTLGGLWSLGLWPAGGPVGARPGVCGEAGWGRGQKGERWSPLGPSRSSSFYRELRAPGGGPARSCVCRAGGGLGPGLQLGPGLALIKISSKGARIAQSPAAFSEGLSGGSRN